MQTPRREFLARTIQVLGALVAATVAGAFAVLVPSRLRKRRREFFETVAVEDLPRRGVKKVVVEVPVSGRTARLPVYIVVSPGGEYTALSARCTHLGCFVNWDRNRNEFLCPCHGGRYDLTGAVVGGPPPRRLERLPVEIRDGSAWIGYMV